MPVGSTLLVHHLQHDKTWLFVVLYAPDVHQSCVLPDDWRQKHKKVTTSYSINNNQTTVAN